ncbi:MAG: glycoside hydrolase family 92 protein [Opitutaceae bacterium]|nr:glycoside hydrolase family 92 protein [Opitutaceae bacterium]
MHPARSLSLRFIVAFLCSTFSVALAAPSVCDHVDPLIGTVGAGNVIIGPSAPFGMVKPGPDCSEYSNTGYRADPTVPIQGFSQVHVSGTGGGAKYGNISVMPFVGETSTLKLGSLREKESAALGYYSVHLQKGNIHTEITASPKVAFYRFGYDPAVPGKRSVKLDAAEFLNESTAYPAKEGQYFVGSEIEIVSDREIRGYGRMRGGWNRGRAYTVYFHAVFDQPFAGVTTWADGQFFPGVKSQTRGTQKTGALLTFADIGAPTLRMKIGISYLSSAKAGANVQDEIPGWDFEATLAATRNLWEKLLGRIEISLTATAAHKRMFYTGLYHSLLMPADRTGENPLWQSTHPSYDDFYAIWDTYRTQMPLITLLDPARQTGIVNALLDIYRYDGYMPDARSGNSNGRTQGGSNADIVIADAYVKKLPGIDYALALQAMLKNADVPPGGDEEKEGRGGLADYNTLGYVSLSYPRSGTRTVEYAYDDFAIATVAKGLGETALFERFSKQAHNWKNLWRADLVHDDATGFIMPKDAKGNWVDTIQGTMPGNEGKTQPFTPAYVNMGKFEDWWSGFLYEGRSWEYSLSIPHDVAELVRLSGGPQAFESRLNTFFKKGHYYVGNEPAFLGPTLYHWIGKPELSSDRIHAIINRSYNDSPKGIPGNDDSGAMSAWLAFHMLGLYPNAGQSHYLLNTPFFAESTLHVGDGKTFRVLARKLSPENKYIVAARLNGRPLARAWLEHAEIVAGGVLEFDLAAQPAGWGRTELPPSLRY